MAKHDVFTRILVNDSEFSQAKVRETGDTPYLSAVNWVNGLGIREAGETKAEFLGKSTPVVTIEYPIAGITIEVIPHTDTKRQCPDCGHPVDAPNPYCYYGCEDFRNAEPEAVIDLDAAASELKALFSG